MSAPMRAKISLLGDIREDDRQTSRLNIEQQVRACHAAGDRTLGAGSCTIRFAAATDFLTGDSEPPSSGPAIICPAVRDIPTHTAADRAPTPQSAQHCGREIKVSRRSRGVSHSERHVDVGQRSGGRKRIITGCRPFQLTSIEGRFSQPLQRPRASRQSLQGPVPVLDNVRARSFSDDFVRKKASLRATLRSAGGGPEPAEVVDSAIVAGDLGHNVPPCKPTEIHRLQVWRDLGGGKFVGVTIRTMPHELPPKVHVG